MRGSGGGGAECDACRAVEALDERVELAAAKDEGLLLIASLCNAEALLAVMTPGD